MNNISGIILKTTPFRDSDLILHIFSPEVGKASIVANRARKAKKKYTSLLEPFDVGRFSIKKSKANYQILDHFQPEKSYRVVREDLDKLSLGSVLCEIYDKLLFEDQIEDSPAIYKVLRDTLDEIESATDLFLMLRHTYNAITYIMSVSGYLEENMRNSPSLNNLKKLVRQIEQITEMKLKTKSALDLVLHSLLKKGPAVVSKSANER